MAKKKWMKKAVKHKGAMTEAAKREGVSNSEYMNEHEHDSGHSGEMARLAKTFAKERPKKHSGKGMMKKMYKGEK